MANASQARTDPLAFGADPDKGMFSHILGHNRIGCLSPFMCVQEIQFDVDLDWIKGDWLAIANGGPSVHDALGEPQLQRQQWRNQAVRGAGAKKQIGKQLYVVGYLSCGASKKSLWQSKDKWKTPIASYQLT